MPYTKSLPYIYILYIYIYIYYIYIYIGLKDYYSMKSCMLYVVCSIYYVVAVIPARCGARSMMLKHWDHNLICTSLLTFTLLFDRKILPSVAKHEFSVHRSKTSVGSHGFVGTTIFVVHVIVPCTYYIYIYPTTHTHTYSIYMLPFVVPNNWFIGTTTTTIIALIISILVVQYHHNSSSSIVALQHPQPRTNMKQLRIYM